MCYLCYLYLYTSTRVQHDVNIRCYLCRLRVTRRVSLVEQELHINGIDNHHCLSFLLKKNSEHRHSSIIYICSQQMFTKSIGTGTKMWRC
jgi:hypothetical protein